MILAWQFIKILVKKERKSIILNSYEFKIFMLL